MASLNVSTLTINQQTMITFRLLVTNTSFFGKPCMNTFTPNESSTHN